MTLKILKLLVSIPVIFLLNSCSPPADKAPAGQIRYKVKRGTITLKVTMHGAIEPLVAVDIKSMMAGKVEKLLVDKGDAVARDQVLLEMDTSDLARKLDAAKTDVSIEQLNLNNTEIRLQDCRNELEKQTELNQKGIVAGRLVEIAKKEYDLALNQQQASQERLSRAEEDYKQAEKDLREAHVVSPLGGTVLKSYIGSKEKVATGAITVGIGNPLVSIGDLSKMVFRTNVNEIDVRKIKVAQPVRITPEAILDRTYDGTVSEIAIGAEAKTDASLVAYPVTIGIADIDDKIIPGMTATAEAVIQEKKGVLYLPIEAVVEEDNQKGVRAFVNNKTLFKPVQTGISDENCIEITEGLKEGEEILLSKEREP